ncbi:platelet-activating factor acetylhydrolase [Apiospora hydei]|uniref:1-alkyl-2-acetylglycerophosphocholine esterase n=1 Tax=Apiospora hydei TaxID=1337664 RepID=A0ABR1WBW6_9PEZI
MRTIQLSTAVVALVCYQAVSSSVVPPPTGPYHVGFQKHVVPVLNEADPFWLNNISTSFLVTVYYPTNQEPEPHDWTRPYLDPATAALYEVRYNLSAGSLSALPSPGLVPEAKPLGRHHHSTLFFSPGGGGPPTEVYTLLLSDLASHGYAVLALDHAHEQPFVRYPNGTGIYGLPILYGFDEPTVLAIQSTRVNDSLALLDYLPALEAKTGLGLSQTHIGIFGHSLGGSSAAATLLAEQQRRRSDESKRTVPSSFRAGMNIDGTFFGPLADVRQPFLMLGAEAHGTSPDPADSDATWPAFASLQKTAPYWRWINIRGALHHDFSDIGYWKQVVPAIRDGDSQLGSIGGDRLVEVWRAYVRSWFDVALLGRGTDEERALFEEGVDAEWPEKIWVGGKEPYR